MTLWRSALERIRGALAPPPARLLESQARLRESEARCERVVLGANAGIWDWDVVKDEYYVSPRLLEMSGFPPGTVFATRDAFMNGAGFHPQDLEQWEKAVRDVLAGGGPRATMDLRMTGRGGPRWVQLSGICFRDAGGAVVRWTGSVTDVTDRKRAEEALRVSEERHARVMEASGDGVWDWDVVKDEFYVSPRLLELSGLPPGAKFASREDYMRQHSPLHPDDRDKWQQAVRQLFASGDSRLTMVLRSIVKGETLWHRLSGICQRDASGRVVRWTGSTLDVTQTKRAEEALRVSEERNARVLEAAAVGDWEWDVLSGRYFVSPRMREMLELPADLQFASREAFLALVPFHPEDRAPYLEEAARNIAAGAPVMEHEYRVLLKAGTVRWMRLRGKSTRNAAGAVTHFSGSLADITEAKLAEEGLRGSEQRYALAMEAAGDGHTDWNLETGEFYISPRLLGIVGHAPGATFADRADWVRRFPFHPEDRKRWEAAVARHFAGREAKFRMDLRIVVNGETRWTAFTFIATRDASGKPVRWTGSISDINDAKLAEEALRVSEERYALALEAAEEGHFDSDLGTNQNFASARANEIFGLPRQASVANRLELLAKTPIHPDDRHIFDELAKVGWGDPAADLQEIEFRIVPRPGEIRWIHSRAKVVRDAQGRPRRRVGVVADITDRKRAEEALRESQDRFARAVAGSADGVWDIDLVARSVYFSPRTRELCGLPAGPEVVPLDGWFEALPLHPEDLPRRFAAMQAHLSGKAPAYDGEFRFLQPDGVYRWRHLHGVCLRDADGKPLRVAGSMADVDARRRAEDALRLSEERYALAAAGASDGIWDEDYTTGLLYRSPRNQEIALGRPSDGIDVRPRAEWEQWHHVHPDEAPKRDAALRAHLEGRTPFYEIEYRVRHPDGAYHWIHARGVCTRDASGRPLRIAGSTTNIDARKAAEEALKLSEERHAFALEVAEEGHFDWNVQTDEIFTSPQAGRVLGVAYVAYRTRADVLAHVRFHPDDWPRVSAEWRAALEGKGVEHEFEYRVLRGEEPRWIRSRWLVFRDAAGAALRVIGIVADITARKLAEEGLRRSEAALRLSEERYALALEAAEEGHFDNDLETDQIFVSARMNEMYGWSRQARVLNRREFLEQIPFHPEDAGRIVGELARQDWQDPPGHLYEMEFRIIPRPGEVRWMHSRAKLVRDAQGRARRRIGVVADVTASKTAEDALRRSEAALRLSEERYALATDGANQGIFDWDLREDRVFHSRRAQELFGLQPGELWRPRHEWASMIPYHPEDVPRVRDSFRRHLNGEKPTCDGEFRVLPRDGEVRWLRQRGLALRDAAGKPYRMAGSVEDITERKKAADELRESESRFRGLTELWSDWYWQQDESLRFTYSSAATDPPDGYPGGSAIGKARWELAGVVPLSSSWAEHRRQLAAHEPFRDFEYSRPADDGTIRYVSTSGTPIFDEKGEFRGYYGVARDITGRKQAAEALRQSEDRFARAVAGSSDGVWDIDLVGRTVYFSPRTRELCGLPPGPQVTPLDGWFENLPLHPEDLPRRFAAVNAHLSGKAPAYDGEFRFLQPDGVYRWRHIHGVCVRDADGKPLRMAGSMADVDARRRAEEELRKSEERYALAMEASDEGHFDWDVKTDHVFASERLVELLGLPPGSRYGSRSAMLGGVAFHAGDGERVARMTREVLEGGALQHQFEYRLVRGSGELRWNHVLWKIIRDADGAAVRVVGTVGDITERRRAEEELRSRKEMLELAQKSARAVAYEWKIRAAGGENRWSPDLEAMYGLPPGGFDGRVQTWMSFVHPDDRMLVKKAIRHAWRAGDIDLEYRIVHPDGSVHWLQSKGRLFFDEAGRPGRMVGFMQDISQRKLAEQEMRKLEQELRRAQRLEAMGTLAGGIAHDFNNILGAILGYGEMAMRDAKTGSRLRRDLDSIMAAGERGRSLVDRILAFSRSGVGERVPVHVEAVVNEALDQVAAKLPDTVAIVPRLRAGRAAMLGDSTQVHQVVMNLANNAVHAMPQGGALRVSLDGQRVEEQRRALIGTVPPGDYIVLKVADTGTGIRPEVLERMFDPFFTTKEVGVGSGLGLSLVHGIVATVGGAIDVATELDKGTTFTVYLPRSGDAQEKTADEDRPLPRGEGERVLVVDDEEPLVRLATETLESLGYAPVGFTSSVNALQEFGANPGGFDAILTDERMPGVTGSAIIREVRRINPSIPILLMSGFVGGAAALKARELGANDVLKKPLLARELATSLARALRP